MIVDSRTSWTEAKDKKLEVVARFLVTMSQLVASTCAKYREARTQAPVYHVAITSVTLLTTGKIFFFRMKYFSPVKNIFSQFSFCLLSVPGHDGVWHLALLPGPHARTHAARSPQVGPISDTSSCPSINL